MKLHTWKEVALEQLNPSFARRVIHGTNMTVANVILTKGSEVPWHSHLNEQMTVMVTGKLLFEFEGGHEFTVSEGQVMEIVPHLPHRVVALEDSCAFDLFAPVRLDWLNGEDAYLRGGKS